MTLIRFPGLIDAHVHLREPGATQKEDFLTGSKAAIAGGFTYILDMPNNPIPTFSIGPLEEKINLSQKAICDIGFNIETMGDNLDQFPQFIKHPLIFGLKVYCNITNGHFLVSNPQILDQIFAAWKSEKPILVHAEGDTLGMVIKTQEKYHRRMHVCHIAKDFEVDLVRAAKKKGQPITAGVCPHHLFLTEESAKPLGPYGQMRPALGNQKDQDALWVGLHDGIIDLIETDHAPHTKTEKESQNPPWGVPELETTIPLLFTAVHNKKITAEQIKTWLYENPKKIFAIPDQENTYIEIDPDTEHKIGEDGYQTKCGWSPFDGWSVFGKVITVVFKGKKLLENGKMI